MRPIKTKNIGSNKPATKGDIEELREDIHADIVEHVVSKEELNSFKGEFSGFKKEIKGDIRSSEKRILRAMKVYHEQAVADLQGAHEDELDIVTEKKDAPPKWRSIPRRLKMVESEVEKIKDQLPTK